MRRGIFFVGFGIMLMIGLWVGFVYAADSLDSFSGNFFEGFESGSLTTNNWTVSAVGTNWAIDTDSYQGVYSIMAEPADGGDSIIKTSIDTTNYGNISFSFYAYTYGLDSGEYIAADWYNGTAWINILQIEDIATYTLYSYNLTTGAEDNSGFKIRFRCLADVPNENCYVDNVNVSGIQIISISLDDYYGLNSSLGRVDEFNTSNLETIEYLELNFSVNSIDIIDSWYLNFTANGTNACSLGNKQSTNCYSYNNTDYQWIQFINGTDSINYDGTQGNQGDRIEAIQIGSGNQINISLRIDEHYNPNVFKWYDGALDFLDVKWQNGMDQRITGDNHLKIEIGQNLVPIDADQYKLDFRAEHVGNLTEPLEAYVCNSSYVSGHVHNFSGCVLVAQRFPSEFQDVGTKFRKVFTRNLIDQIGDFKYVILETLEQNSSNYYAIKTYNATKSNYTTHWEYSTDLGDNWTNLGDGYESELNINWFYNGADPTAFVYRLWTNTSDGVEKYLEGNITWSIDPTNNYPPILDLRDPISLDHIRFPYNVTFLLSDTNDDDLNGSLYLYQGGILNKTLVTDMNQTNKSYLWDDSTLDGTYDLILEVCELNTPDLFCVNVSHEIFVDNSAPQWSNVSKNETIIYWNNTIKFNASWMESHALSGYIFSTNQTGTWVNSSYISFSGTSNVSENISVITANAGTDVGWSFFADDLAGNTNQTDIQSFVVQARLTSLTFSVPPYAYASLGTYEGSVIYPQGRSPSHDYDVYVPLNVRYVDTLTGDSIDIANCYVTNDETSDNISLTYNSTTGNFTGQVNTYLMAGRVNFSVACSDTNYVNATGEDIVYVHSFYTLIERENITYGGNLSDSTTHWMRKGPFEGILYTLTKEANMSAGVNLIQEFPFCGSGKNCSYLRNFNWIGIQKFKLNVSVNDTTCELFVCREITDFYLNLRLKNCIDPQPISANTATVMGGNITQNLTIQQDSYLFLNLYANCSSSVSLSTNVYFNYTDQPTTIEVYEAQPMQASSSVLEDYQLDAGYFIGPNQTANVSKRSTIQFYNAVNNSQYLEYWYVSEANVIYPNSIISNMTYIYNNTGQLLASDNISAGAPNLAAVYSNNEIFWETESIPANATINETLNHSYKDAIRNEEVLIENTPAKTIWNINLYEIFVPSEKHKFLINITAWTNYSTYGVVNNLDSDFNVSMTTSQGTTDISNQITINNAMGTLTFPVINFTTDISEVNYIVTARELVKPTIVLNNPVDNYNTTSSLVNFNWTARDNLDSVLSCNLTIDGVVNATNISSQNDTATNYTVSLSDGVHYWNVTCIDDADNLNTSETRIVNLDTVLPQIQFVYPTTVSGNQSQTYILANITASDNSLDNVSIYLYNSTTLVQQNSSTAPILYINFSSLPYATYYLNATANDNFGNTNQTETRTITLEVFDTCDYSGSGNWIVNCSNNCLISSNIDLLGNNISLAGQGSFSITANITNFEDLYVAGDSAINRCEIYCSQGGCFI